MEEKSTINLYVIVVNFCSFPAQLNPICVFSFSSAAVNTVSSLLESFQPISNPSLLSPASFLTAATGLYSLIVSFVDLAHRIPSDHQVCGTCYFGSCSFISQGTSIRKQQKELFGL